MCAGQSEIDAAVELNELFRPEMQQASSGRVLGEVVLKAPPSLAVVAGVTAAIIALAGLVLTFATFPRVEKFHGRLVPEAGLVTITAPRGGVVTSVPVQDGDRVTKGQIVAVVRVSSDSLVGNAGAAINAGLRSEASATLELASLDLVKLEQAREDALETRTATLADIAQLERQMALQAERISLLTSQLERAETLATKGFYPQRQLDDNRSALLAAQQTRLGYERELLKLRRSVAEVDHQLASMASRVRESRARARQSQSQLDQRTIAADLDDQYTVRSSAPGRLTGVSVHPGQWIDGGRSLATVLPDHVQLEVEAQIRSRARAWVAKGQTVTIMLDAFPHQRFGSLSGTIIAVAEAATVADGEAAAHEPSYRVRISLPRQWMKAYGRQVGLQAGMVAEGRIVLERRSLLHILFEPLFAGTGRPS